MTLDYSCGIRLFHVPDLIVVVDVVVEVESMMNEHTRPLIIPLKLSQVAVVKSVRGGGFDFDGSGGTW